jgi:hypothetical protein
MTIEQEDKLIWSCIASADNRLDPSASDGYNEGEMYRACVNTLRTFKESEEYIKLQKDAESWRFHVKVQESIAREKQERTPTMWDAIRKEQEG